MRAILAVCVLTSCMMTPTALQARGVPEVYGRIVKYAGEFDPFRVGVSKFTIEDPGRASIFDLELAEEVGDVIFADLDFSYLFEPVRPDTVYLRIMGMDQIDRRGWRHLGADYLLDGDVQIDGEAVTVRYTMTDVVSGRRHFTREMKSRRGSARLMAHAIADEVYRELARAEGVFQSRIVYLHEEGDQKELHVADWDGAGDLTVTADRTISLSPRWAGANAISYTSYKDGNPDVWLLDLGRDRSTKFSSMPGLNSGCSWTADGKRYVLSMSVEGDPEIYVGERSSRRSQRLTFSPGIDVSPAFSSDGSRIVFTSDRSGSPQIYIMDEDGANVERLTYEGQYNDSPDWSPTLDLVAFVSRRDGLFQICTIRPDGSGFRRLTEVGSNENPHWSPDGLHLVFASNRTGQYEIYTMNFDGAGVRRLTTDGGNTNPSWSP
ncbi:MAG TPA: Tol-Pal system beta propeller repeat protein TolB [Acidobacteriota bacterium]|nr:Tol-Pal system beta propeller repeat protein TolB [Acidobacteriota bacterium]